MAIMGRKPTKVAAAKSRASTGVKALPAVTRTCGAPQQAQTDQVEKASFSKPTLERLQPMASPFSEPVAQKPSGAKEQCLAAQQRAQNHDQHASPASQECARGQRQRHDDARHAETHQCGHQSKKTKRERQRVLKHRSKLNDMFGHQLRFPCSTKLGGNAATPLLMQRSGKSSPTFPVEANVGQGHRFPAVGSRTMELPASAGLSKGLSAMVMIAAQGAAKD